MKVIYFTEGEDAQAFRFVKAYRRKRLFRKEKMELSYFLVALDVEDDVLSDIIYAVKRMYPNANVGCDTLDNFKEKMLPYVYYATCLYNGKELVGFDGGNKAQGEQLWEMDIEDAMLYLDGRDASDHAEQVARSTGKQVTLDMVYVNRTNMFSEARFVITCTSRKSGFTKFYSRTEGTRLRLVKTSDAAALFTYRLALDIFDELKATSKSFWYDVIPYIQGVNCMDLERLAKEGKIARAVEVTTKIQWLK